MKYYNASTSPAHQTQTVACRQRCWPLALLVAVLVAIGMPHASSFAATEPQRNPEAAQASAANTPLQLLGVIPGEARFVSTDAGLALAAGWNRVTFLNIMDPEHPRAVSTMEIPDRIGGAALKGQYAYIVHGECSGSGPNFVCHSSFEVIDLSDPATPTIVGRFNTPHNTGGVLTLFESYALFSEGSAGFGQAPSVLRILDISNPRRPTQVATLPADIWPPTQVLVATHPVDHQRYIYVFSGSMLWIYDWSDIRTPKLVGFTSVPMNSDSTLYATPDSQKLYAYGAEVIDDSSIIRVLDLTDVYHPALAGSVVPPTRQSKSVVIGNVLITSGREATYLFDLSQPTSPTITTPLSLVLTATPVRIDSQHALLASATDLGVMDVSDPTKPTLDSIFKTVSTSDVLFHDQQLYVATDSQIERIDVLNPANPQPIESLPGEFVAVADQRVATFGDGQFALYRIADPTSVQLGTLTIPFQFKEAEGLALSGPSGASGRFGYLAWNEPTGLPVQYGYGNGGLFVIDAANPAAPKQVGSVPIHEIVTTMVERYPYIYLATTDYGTGKLYAIDVTQPSAPVIRGMAELPSRALDLAVDSGRIYAATVSRGLQIIDVAQPALPRIIGEYSLSGWNDASSVAVDRGYVYLIQWLEFDDSVLYVLNASNAAHPLVLSRLPISMQVAQVRVQNGLIALAHAADGISLLRYGTDSGTVVDTLGLPISGVTINQGSTADTGSSVAASGFKGSYAIAGAKATQSIQSDVLTPQLAGYTSWPAQRSLGEAASGKANFTLLAPPTTIAVTSASGAKGGFTDVSGATTSFTIDGSALALPATLHITPTIGPAVTPWAFAGHAFELQLEGSTTGQPFARVTLAYRSSEVRVVSDESRLTLRRWDGSAWQDATTTCTPSAGYTRNLNANTLSITLCQNGRYALFGPTNRLYFPAIAR